MTYLKSIDEDIAEQGALVQRIEILERKQAVLVAENIAIRAKLVALETHGIRKTATPAVKPIGERQVTISTPPPSSTFKMPTPSELTQLIDAVGKHFPALLSADGPAFTGDPTERRGQFDAQFVAAFEAIGHMKRTERPRTDVYASFHVETAESVLKSFGRPSMTIRGNAFLAACLAHFDVPVSGIGRQHEGIVPEVGLHQYSGRPASDQWRKIIAGQSPKEVGVQRPPSPPSPATVRQHF